MYYFLNYKNIHCILEVIQNKKYNYEVNTSRFIENIHKPACNTNTQTFNARTYLMYINVYMYT